MLIRKCSVTFMFPPSIVVLTALCLGASRTVAQDKMSKYDGMPQVLIPAGEFTMGADDEDAHGRTAEFPPHRVQLSAYWIDKFEVSNEQFVRFLNARVKGNRAMIYSYCDIGNAFCNIRYDEKTEECYVEKGYEKHPVCAVSWMGANAYAESVRRRLPTEAEWEKAARGTDARRYPWGSAWEPKNANTREGGAGQPSPVGTWPKDVSPFGVMDVAGNVGEWTKDVWEEDFYSSSPLVDPVNVEGSHYHVVRGGAWCLTEWDARTTSRQFLIPSAQRRYMGFRCAETVPEPLPAPAEVSGDVLFYTSLDGHAHADAAKGERRPIDAPRSPQYVEGKRGQAILVGDVGNEYHYLKFEAPDNFRIEEGTVAMWIKPHGWSGADHGFRYFFMIADESTCKFYLYRFQEKNLLVLAGNGIEGQWGSLGMPTDDWKDDQWIHLAVTWKDRLVKLYLDGKPVSQTLVPPDKFFRGMPPAFHLGFSHNWGANDKKAATAVDEFIIFSRALESEEVLRQKENQGNP